MKKFNFILKFGFMILFECLGAIYSKFSMNTIEQMLGGIVSLSIKAKTCVNKVHTKFRKKYSIFLLYFVLINHHN